MVLKVFPPRSFQFDQIKSDFWSGKNYGLYPKIWVTSTLPDIFKWTLNAVKVGGKQGDIEVRA
jgi:hypothetical protein